MSDPVDFLDRILFTLLDAEAPPRREGVPGVPFRFFDGSHVVSVGLQGAEAFSDWSGQSAQFSFHPDDVSPRDLDTFDYSVVTDSPDRGVLFNLIRCRYVSPRQARGRVVRCTPRIVEHTLCGVSPGHLFTSRVWLGGSRSGFGGWRTIGPNNRAARSTHALRPGDELFDCLRMSMALAFTAQNFWHVKVGYEGLPSLRFRTDPVGARAIFRLRDVPPGKKRRAALRNWVCEHSRKNRRVTPEELIKIKRHLRGATAFTWNHMRCEIEPSVDDIALLGRIRSGAA